MFLPHLALASNVYIDTSHSEFYLGDTVLFTVRVDTENKTINTVEGSVKLDYPAFAVSLVDINTAGSKLSIWPNKPLPSVNNTEISFVGGTPSGFNSKDAIIFNFILKLQKVGQVILTPSNFSVYLSDGKGTQDEVMVRNFVVNVLPKTSDSKSVDDWNRLISDDKTPPEPFEINLGQEGSVFDGKKFLSFVTTDGQSDIAYYEVRENDLPPVRGEHTYILQEQNKPVRVVIVAYDSAGNTRESIYVSPPENRVIYLVIFVIAFTALFVILPIYIFRKIRKNKK